MQHFLDQLDWRRAVKTYDPEKKLSEETIQHILRATQMAPSSFGIQPYHVYVVTDVAVREKLRAAAWDQAQFTDASHLLVFATRTDVMQRIDEYFDTASGGDEEKKAAMQGYRDMMEGFIGGMPQEAQKPWADRQTYIALGFALAAAAELEVDSCPMEGFSTADFDQILGLPENMKSVVCLSLGYTNEEATRAKVRFDQDDLFTQV